MTGGLQKAHNVSNKHGLLDFAFPNCRKINWEVSLYVVAFKISWFVTPKYDGTCSLKCCIKSEDRRVLWTALTINSHSDSS